MVSLPEIQDSKIIQTSSCRVVFRPEFDASKYNLLNILQWFPENKNSIHNDRNILKIVEFGENVTVIKSFKIPTLFSRLIYTFVRSSKAKRSFENSLVLKNKGFNVPEPLAFLEFFNKGLLKESFYISRKLVFDCTLHEVVRGQKFLWEDILPLVVEQAYCMHQSDIIHRDFSHGNVLVSNSGGRLYFSFVDLNRLYMGHVSFKMGLKSLVRLIDNDQTLEIIAKKYAECGQQDAGYTRMILGKYFSRHQRQKRFKSKLKAYLGIKKK